MVREFDIGPYSAYAIAVKYGYKGTEAEWIAAQEKARTDSQAAAAAAAQSARSAALSEGNAQDYAGQAASEAEKAASSAREAKETVSKHEELNSSQTAAIAALSDRSDAVAEYISTVEQACSENYAYLLELAEEFGVPDSQNALDN